MHAVKLIADGKTVLVENRLVVTTIPYSPCAADISQLIERGEQLKAAHRLPWLVLNHDAHQIQQLLGSARPDFVHDGHYHGATSFSRRYGNTLFLSAGQRLGVAFPNHIELDPETGTCRVEIRSQGWLINRLATATARGFKTPWFASLRSSLGRRGRAAIGSPSLRPAFGKEIKRQDLERNVQGLARGLTQKRRMLLNSCRKSCYSKRGTTRLRLCRAELLFDG
jgi:hypothetical protein